ncbi:NIPA-like protein 3, partial [Clarias magur]
MQKQSHVVLSSTKDPRQYYCTKTWWCGLVLLLIGEGSLFASYAFAPLSLIAPLSAVSLIGNKLYFRISVSERKMEAEGVSEALYSIVPRLCLDCSGHVPLHHVLPELPRATDCREHREAPDWLACPPVPGSVTVITVKAVAGMVVLSIQGSLQLSYPIFYVMFVCMVATIFFQASFLAQASHLYDSSLIACVNYIMSTVFAVGAGAIFYLEFNQADILHICLFLLGCAVCFLGVFLITKNKKNSKAFEPYVTMDMSVDFKRSMKMMKFWSNGSEAYSSDPEEDEEEMLYGENEEESEDMMDLSDLPTSLFACSVHEAVFEEDMQRKSRTCWTGGEEKPSLVFQ